MRSLCLLLVALSALFALATAADDPTPIQHRIALQQPHGMTLSWSTLGPIGVTPTVAIGHHPEHLNRSVKGWTQHYDPSITWFHHVVVDQLQPSTRYYWTVTSPANLSSSLVLNFTTAPRAGDSTPFVVSINGDMGLVNEDDTLVTMKRWAADGTIDLFWHVGDMSYADDWRDLNMTYEEAMELWMNRMTGIWTSTAYMTCPGNHEATCDEGTPEVCPDGQRNFTSYRERFRMPARESGAVNNMWFSFDYGLVHFVSIDTEVDYPNSPEGRGTWGDAGPFGDQLGWLAADLKKANANRQNVPWILVSGHRPYYASSADGLWPDSRRSFEPLFNAFSVDIVYWYASHCTHAFLTSLPAAADLLLPRLLVRYLLIRGHIHYYEVPTHSLDQAHADILTSSLIPISACAAAVCRGCTRPARTAQWCRRTTWMPPLPSTSSAVLPATWRG